MFKYLRVPHLVLETAHIWGSYADTPGNNYHIKSVIYYLDKYGY